MTQPRILSAPQCLSLGDGYIVEWEDDGIRVEAHYLRDGHGDIQAELAWYERLADGWRKLRGGGRLNLLAPTTVRAAGKVLSEVNGAAWEWGRALEQACEAIVEAQRAGEPVRRYQDLARSLPKQKWLVDGLVPEGVTTLIHADWESGKSMLAQALMLSIASGVPFCEREVRKQGPVLYLDWETDEERWARRMRILIAGLEMDPDNPYPLLYRRMRGLIRDQVSRLREIVDRHRVVAVAVDSVGWAAGGGSGEDLKEANPAIAAMEAIRALRVTPIVLAHQSKGGSGRAATTYGSVFFEAGARFVWGLRAKRKGADELEMTLVNDKNNDGPHQPDAGLRLTFSDERAWFARMAVSSEPSVIYARVKRALQEQAGQTAEEIAAVLDIAKADTVYRACERMVTGGELLKDGGGRGSKAKYSLPGETAPEILSLLESSDGSVRNPLPIGGGVFRPSISAEFGRSSEGFRASELFCGACNRPGADRMGQDGYTMLCLACADEETG